MGETFPGGPSLSSPSLSAPGPPSSFLHSTRALLAGAGVLVVAAIVVVLVVVLGSSSGHRHGANGPLPPLSSRNDNFQTIFTEGSAILTDPAGEIAALHALGVNRVRVSFAWSSIAPDPTSRTPPHFDAANPAAYPASGWAVYDTIARDLTRDHMGLDLVLAPYPPKWAEGTGVPKESTPPPVDWNPSAPMFEKFVEAVGTRYSGHFTPPGARSPLPRETFWSLWNEPNGGFQLAPQTIDHGTVDSSPYHYRLLADAAWTALHTTGHGHDTTLIGELAPVGTYIQAGKSNDFAVMDPLQFVRALYCVGANDQPLRGRAATLQHCPPTAAGSKRFVAQNPVLFHATAFADHPYPQALAPDQKIPGGADDAVLAQLPTLFTTLDRLQRAYGSSKRFDVYSTEFGYITTPPATQAGRISQAKAARWINWSEYLSWRMPRLLSYDQFLFADPPPVPHKPYRAFASGLANYTGAPKPGYYAFRMPIWLPQSTAKHGGTLEVWGCVRPAKLYPMGHRAPAQIQFEAKGTHHWSTIATVSTRTRYGYFDVDERFPASGSVRIRWTPSHGPAMESRVAPITVG